MDRYQFTEKERDAETNLDYFGARYYGSLIGRWLTPDPLADQYPGWSPYNYVLGNPLRYIDEEGEFPISYIVGFIRGGHKEGWQSFKNMAQIWSSFGRGNLRQIASKFTWELPQQLFGVGYGWMMNLSGNIDNISHNYGATFIKKRKTGGPGVALGSVIQLPNEAKEYEFLYRHEYGHYIQSQILGPLYVGLAIISGFSATVEAIFPSWTHLAFPTEKWATNLGNNYFSKQKSSIFQDARFHNITRFSNTLYHRIDLDPWEPDGCPGGIIGCRGPADLWHIYDK